MSYDLAIARGLGARREEERDPLDVEAARAFLRSVDGIVEADGEEYYWHGPNLYVTFYLVPSMGSVREIGVTVQGGGGVPKPEVRREYRQIAEHMFELARRLEANVIDTGIERLLTDPDDAVATYAGDRAADDLRPSLDTSRRARLRRWWAGPSLADARARPHPEPPPRPQSRFPVDFHDLPRPEAERRYRTYLDAAPARLESLRREVESSGGPTLDASPESLRPLWPWVLERGRLQQGPFPSDADVPVWMDENAARLTPASVWLADGVAYYLAESFLANVEGVHWELGHDPHPHWSEENRPILVGLRLPLSPPYAVSGKLSRALEQPGDPPANPSDHPDALYLLYQYWAGAID